MASELWRDFLEPQCTKGKEGGAQALADLKDYKNCCVAEYVWVDANGQTRSKCRTMDRTPRNADDVSIWTFNGACTGQASESQSEVYLVPRKVFADPFKGAPHVLVVAEAITQGMEPAVGNFRALAAENLGKLKLPDAPWFGIEQEYVLTDDQGNVLETTGVDSYCGRGAMNLPEFMREIMGEHYAYCLSAGIKIGGMNVEAGQAQGEYQVGPCRGLNAGDHAIAARFVLHRAANRYRCGVSFKPYDEETGCCSGMHVNASTAQSRVDGGIMCLEFMCRELANNHEAAMSEYGEGNKDRLQARTGTDCSSVDKCTYDVADRSASLRIPRHVGIVNKGHLEDRRPAANADPYRVLAHMAISMAAGIDKLPKDRKQGDFKMTDQANMAQGV